MKENRKKIEKRKKDKLKEIKMKNKNWIKKK